MPDSILTALGVKKVSVLIAGAVGGLISLQHYTELTLRGKLVIILSSICLANYATLPIVTYFGESADKFELGIAAAVGLFGLSIASSAMNLVKDIALWKSLISRIFGGERE